MKLYRIPRAPVGTRWQRTQDEAKAIARQSSPIDVFKAEEVPTDARGLVAFLNERDRMAAAAASLIPARDPEPELTTAYTGPLVPAPTAPRAPGYAEQSIQLDEDFDRLPLSRQLDLAARAMENARTRL